ncbi:MAG: ABC transporter substrate-binding protein, partial [Massilia sp.]|uniref:ABC transporter substrate-binding protein n=1 Tax=Massilia sp. TaxID=1882437 RepID=UPI002FCA0555
MRVKAVSLAIVGLVGGLAMSGANAQEIIKIGHIGPVSGPQAHFGKDDENGVRMAIEDLNAKNPEIGGKKVKFQLVAEDDGADPKQGTA